MPSQMGNGTMIRLWRQYTSPLWRFRRAYRRLYRSGFTVRLYDKTGWPLIDANAIDWKGDVKWQPMMKLTGPREQR